MKIPKPLLLLLAAFLALAASSVRARADDYQYFYDTLDPYGQWIEVAGYGYCWQPSGVDENWAPYTDGYWAYTDGGWTWVSYEDWGGITYHYGRWLQVEDAGWVWVPDTQWAPAWVSWRTSDDYVGWAPLPPQAHFEVGVGFSTWVDAQYDIGPGCYSFVQVGNFGAPALRSVIVRREENVTIINRTTNITNITVTNNNVFVGGPSYSTVAARSSRPIPTLHLVRQSDPAAIRAAGGKTLAHAQGNQLVVLAPKITAPAAGAHLAPPKVAKTISNVKPEHGWSIVKDPAQRQKLQAAIKSQAKGATPSSAPAHAVTAAEMKPQVRTGTGNGTAESKPAIEKGNTAPTETAAAAAITPEGKKGNTKKGMAPAGFEAASPETAAPAAVTPKGKKGNIKKGPTPAGFEAASPETAPAAEAAAAPKKGKSKKAITPAGFEAASPETAPAAEAAAPPKKGKSKKAITPAGFEAANGGAAPAEEAAPAPKQGKSKKAKTPALYTEPGQAAPAQTKGGETNLQPFMSNGGEAAPAKKARKMPGETAPGAKYGSEPAKAPKAERYEAYGKAASEKESAPLKDKNVKGEKKGKAGVTPVPY